MIFDPIKYQHMSFWYDEAVRAAMNYAKETDSDTRLKLYDDWIAAGRRFHLELRRVMGEDGGMTDSMIDHMAPEIADEMIGFKFYRLAKALRKIGIRPEDVKITMSQDDIERLHLVDAAQWFLPLPDKIGEKGYLGTSSVGYDGLTVEVRE